MIICVHHFNFETTFRKFKPINELMYSLFWGGGVCCRDYSNWTREDYIEERGLNVQLSVLVSCNPSKDPTTLGVKVTWSTNPYWSDGRSLGLSPKVNFVRFLRLRSYVHYNHVGKWKQLEKESHVYWST